MVIIYTWVFATNIFMIGILEKEPPKITEHLLHLLQTLWISLLTFRKIYFLWVSPVDNMRSQTKKASKIASLYRNTDQKILSNASDYNSNEWTMVAYRRDEPVNKTYCIRLHFINF